MKLEVLYSDDRKDVFDGLDFMFAEQFVNVNKTEEVTIRIPYTQVKKFIVTEQTTTTQ